MLFFFLKKEHITVPSRWSHFIRGFPLVLVLAVSWRRSSFACLRSNTVNTPSRHSLENEKKICILTACLKTLTSSDGFPCTVLRLWRQTKSEAPGYQEQLHAMRPCKWKTCCILLGMRSMRETIQDTCESLDHSGISPHISHGYAITNLVSVSAYPKSSSDSTASVHTMSVFTRCPISLCAAPRVLMHSVLPHPLGPIIHTWEKKAGEFIVPLKISQEWTLNAINFQWTQEKMLVGPYLL